MLWSYNSLRTGFCVVLATGDIKGNAFFIRGCNVNGKYILQVMKFFIVN